MRFFDNSFSASLLLAPDTGIRPAWFFWVLGKDRETGGERPVGFWSGDEDILQTLVNSAGQTVTRTYVGGCNLSIPDGIPYKADMNDNPVVVSISQLSDASQALIRGYDPRMAYCELHCATWNGGALSSAPQIMYAGMVDEAPITTPVAGSEGGISVTVRSEILSQLTVTNPAKTSDAHQKRRRSDDDFCLYSGTIKARKIQWFTD